MQGVRVSPSAATVADVTAHRSFADDLRSRSVEELAFLVERRPDLLTPPPNDIAGLASRAGSRGSVQLAVHMLPLDQLRALELVTYGVELPESAGAVVDALRLLGLLWHSPDGPTVVHAVPDVVRRVAPLGPPAAELGITVPTEIPAAVERLGADARRLFDVLTERNPQVRGGNSVARAASAELAEAGLAVLSGETTTLPREVGLAHHAHVFPSLRAPRCTGPAADRSAVDAEAGLAAITLVRRVERLLTLWSHEPPRVMRKGGLSQRDRRRTEQLLDLDDATTAFVVEVAYAAGLIGQDDSTDPVFIPTTYADQWLADEPEGRWLSLVEAWHGTLRAPSLAAPTPGQPAKNLLSRDLDWPLMRRRRQEMLDLLADVSGSPAAESGSAEAHDPSRPAEPEPDITPAPHDSTPTATPDDVDALLRWRHPLHHPHGAPTRSSEVLAELALLGLAVGTVPSSPGLELAGGEVSAATAAALMPVLVDHVYVQADLTAIAPGPLTDDAHRLMHLVADVESSGGAIVFRFSQRSLTRALDGGMAPDALLDRLRAVSRTPLPQPLEYLAHEAAAQHGRTFVGQASSYIRSDDHAALAAVVGDPALSRLGLRLLAPGVAISSSPARQLLTALSSHGHSALAESTDGALLDGARPRRAPAPRTMPTVTTPSVSPERAAAIAAHLLANDEPEKTAATDHASITALVEQSATEGSSVVVEHVNAGGEISRTRLRPADVQAGLLSGSADGRHLGIPLSRVLSVSPA